MSEREKIKQPKTRPEIRRPSAKAKELRRKTNNPGILR
jgi:hypothetical protein